MNRKDARREIKAVNDALKLGYPPTSGGGLNAQSAIRVAADALQLDYRTLRYHVGVPGTKGLFQRQFGLEPDWKLYVPEAKPEAKINPRTKAPLGGTDEDRRVVALEDENRRLQEALRTAHRAAIDDDAAFKLLGIIKDMPNDPPAWLSEYRAPKRKSDPDPEVPVTCWSDWHYGEVVNLKETNGLNEYNPQIARERADRLFQSTVKLCQHFHTGNYPGIVVNLMGDFVSGNRLHPELAITDAKTIIEQVFDVLGIITAGLTMMADNFENVFVPCVPGNHGRITAKPEFKHSVLSNYDTLIYYLLRKHFADDPRVRFMIRESEDAYYGVFGTYYFVVHGDKLGVRGGDGIIGPLGPITRGEIKKAAQAASMGEPYDRLVIGHYHTELWLPRVHASNTLKGWDEYAKLQLGAKPSRPTQPLWFNHPRGITAMWPIHVDLPPASDKPWIHWPTE